MADADDHARPTEKHSSRRPERSRDRDRERDKDKDRSHRSSHRHHHHRSSHHHRSRSRDKERNRDKDGDRDRDRDRDRHHRKKRSRRDDEVEGSGSDRHHKSRRESSQKTKSEDVLEPTEPAQLVQSVQPAEPSAKRDEWMVEPSADFIDYTQRGARKPSPTNLAVKPDYRPTIYKNELNQQLRDGKSLDEYADDENGAKEGEVAYMFGDSGSNWRMTRLKRCYETAKETGVDLEVVALERYGDLRLLDDAREEEMELGRREVYGMDRKDAKEKPTGELWRERLAKRQNMEVKLEERAAQEQARILDAAPPPPQPTTTATTVVDQTTLNKMRAALLKAQLRGDLKAAKIEEDYNAAVETARSAPKTDGVVVLSAMDTRQIAGLGGRVGREVVMGKKGKVVENEDMTLDDMLREEKITRGQGAGRQMAERISRDAKFDDNLDYMDENAAKLAKRVQKNEIDIKNMAINEFKKVQRVLDTCPLCQQDDKPPVAPVISLATRVFLTLPTEPELCTGGAVIVPIQHRTNMLECDDDEWEEVRNFMKSLTRMYAAQDRDVIFYENAASPARRKHAAIFAVPLPRELGEMAPAYFKEAILSADEQWSQHKPIIDTLKSGHGKMAFRKALIKEMPYFHVWFTIDGGMGHIIEDENRWPRADLFARELLGGILECEPNIIKKQGRWRGGRDRREEEFKKTWQNWDWTKVLYG